jgi:putative aldouronate transport system substrate-binding protein
MNTVKYVRNLIANKLIDPEAYSQTDAIATEKITQGQYAVLSGHYYEVYNRIRPFIDKHPEADYVPVGPLNDSKGDPFKFAMVPAGDNAVFLTKNNKNPEASMRLMNYLASDEGWLLTNYGVEGVHYDMTDGKPVAKKEWIDKEKQTPGTITNEGFGSGSVYTFLAGQNRTYSLAGGTFGWQYDEQYKHAQEVGKILRPNGVEMAKGIQAISVIIGYEKYEEMKPLLDEIFQYKVYQRAIFAKSDKEATGIIEEVRKALEKAGIHELEKYAAEKDKEQEIIKYLNE